MHEVHPSNQVLLDGAVFDGPYEGLMRRRTAAGWLALYDHCPRAGAAAPATEPRARLSVPSAEWPGACAGSSLPRTETLLSRAASSGPSRRGSGS